MSETTRGSSSPQDRQIVPFEVRKSYTHGRFLLNRTRRELAAMQRLSEISPTTPLVNEPWRLLLMILAANIRGKPAYSQDLAQDIGIRAEISLRYLRSLESDRLVLLGEPGPRGRSACVGDEGVLRIIRYFLPEAANE